MCVCVCVCACVCMQPMLVNIEKFMQALGGGRKEGKRMTVAAARCVCVCVCARTRVCVVQSYSTAAFPCRRSLTTFAYNCAVFYVCVRVCVCVCVCVCPCMCVCHRGALEDVEVDRLFPTELVTKEAVRLAEQDG